MRAALAEDVTVGDISPLLSRLARPLPGPIPPELNDRLAHRHLDLIVAGLRPVDRAPIDGPGPSHDELRGLRDLRGGGSQPGPRWWGRPLGAG